VKISKELEGLRNFLRLLKSPEVFLMYKKENVKPKQIEILEREIASLEKFLSRRSERHENI